MAQLRWTMTIATGALLLLAAPMGCSQPETSTDEPSETAQNASANGLRGKIVAVTGPGGLASSKLAEGTFLGAGGKLEPGQDVRTPQGTLAEIELDSGARLRLNEQTQLSLPGADHPDTVTLEKGEIVVLASSGEPVAVATGEETLRIQAGEAQIRHLGNTRRFAVVHGSASLEADGRTFELRPGESLQAPLAPGEPEPRPELSLRPLDDTDWARTFDAAAAMADAVPRGIGSLTARRPGQSIEKQRLRLTDQSVTVNISGRVAHTQVEQAFFNDRPAVLEGIYRFPIPSEATVSGLGLLVGNTWMDGEIVEKQRGRRIFKQIVDATIPRDPALLEWERGNIFKLRVFPIPGRGDRRVRLSYTEVLPVVGGKLRYRFPLGGTGATDAPIDRFAFTVNVDARELDAEQLAAVSTPMLALQRSDRGDVVELHTQREKFLPTFDLGVDIPVPEQQAQVHTATHLDKDGQAYFMVTLQPDFELPRDDRPVHYAFVLDRSHSTTPELWTTARGVVDALTEMMDPQDHFTVLACDTACDEHPAGLQPASRTAVDDAQTFLRDQDLAGASDIGAMLTHAHEVLDRRDAQARQVVVYLGDGSPSSGEMSADGLTNLLRESMGTTRVMAVALGARSDLTTLGAVVEATAGDLVRADARDDLRGLVRELRLRSEVPAATDVRFDVPAGMAMVRDDSVTALRPGDTVVLAGKLRHPVSGTVTMRARGPAGPVEASFPVDLTAARGSGVAGHLPRTWAALQIQHLTQTRGFDAHDEIVELSKDYTVLSRYTSLIVLENDAMYREFNVVRRANDKDSWDGNLAQEKREQSEDETAAEITADLGLLGTGRGGGGSGEGRIGTNADASAATRSSAEPEPEPKPGDSSRPLGKTGGDLGDQRERQDRDGSRDEDADPFVPEPFPGATPPTDPRFGGRGTQPGGGESPDADLDDAEVIGGFFDPAPPSGAAEGPLPPARPKPKSTEKKRRSKPSSSSGSSSGSSGRGWHDRPRLVRRLRLRDAPAPSSRGLAKLRELQSAVQADPTNRSAHRRLVRAAMRMGDAGVLDFARAWAEADPDHAGALTALADALAAQGDPLALRAYESMFEVRPFSTDDHEALADAYARKGDLRRSCSHRRALVSIDPSDIEHRAALVKCLRRDGRLMQADAERERFATAQEAGVAEAAKRSSKLEALAAKADDGLHGRAQLRVEVSWRGEADLDVGLIDARGRRLSTMRPERKVRATEGAGHESVTVRRVRRPMFVEITRVGTSVDGVSSPVTATVVIRTPHGKKTHEVVLGGEGSRRLAVVAWSERWR